MDKREIERALLGLVGIADSAPLILHGYFSELVDALAKQIVIECEVEHSKFHTIVKNEIGNLPNRLIISEHHGTPGKALAIILPLKGEDD